MRPRRGKPPTCRRDRRFQITMTNSHAIDYLVITFADVTAALVIWLVGKGWLVKKAQQISANWQIGDSILAVIRSDVDMDVLQSGGCSAYEARPEQSRTSRHSLGH